MITSIWRGMLLPPLFPQLFLSQGCHETIKEITQGWILWSQNDSQSHLPPPSLLMLIRYRGTYPGEEWQTDFTQMPPKAGFKYFLVFVGPFTGWIEAFPFFFFEAFPIRRENATEVSKYLLKEILPRFGLWRILQSNDRPFLFFFFLIYLLIMLLQLSHFHSFTQLHPAHPLPPSLIPSL